jgi:hypothetical protein
VSDPILDAAALRLTRARAAYVKLATQPQRDALEVARDKREAAYKKFSSSRHRWDGRVAGCESNLRAAEVRCNEIFDSILDGEVQP